MNGIPVYSAILLHLSILLIPVVGASAKPSDTLPSALSESVLLLRSKMNGVCATGFLLSDGTLVTNAHVTRTLCPSGSCLGVELLRAPHLGSAATQTLAITKASIIRELPVLDVSFLKLEGANLPVGFFSSATSALPGSEVYSLGYPKCGALSLSEGKIDSLDSLKLSTTTRAAHGSSGSPIFNSDFKLIGIAEESESIAGGFLSMFSDYTFETIALRADVALELRGISDDALLLTQADALLENYRTSVRTLSGLERARAAISFVAAVEGIRDALLFTPGREQELKVMAALGQYLDYIPRLLPEVSQSELLNRLQSLVLAYNLELKGAHQQFMIPARSETIFESLDRSVVPVKMREEFKELIIFAVRNGYQGLELYGLLLGLKLTMLAIVALCILGWSMGYVFAGSRGGFFKRLLWAFSALVLWPLPVLAIWWKRKKSINH